MVDFSNLQGAFGKITEGSNFKGSGGTSAKEGFLFALTLAPTVMVAMGLIQIFENYGALKAAERLLTPIMKPILGHPWPGFAGSGGKPEQLRCRFSHDPGAL